MKLGETYPFNNFTIRKSYLVEDDIPEMVQLLISIYKSNLTKINEVYVRWKYLGFPEGKTIMYQALNQEGEVVATRSAAPTTMLFKGKPKQIFFNIDAGTKPNYRQNNLYSELQTQHMRDNSSDTFILTYPAYQGIAYNTYINKLGWTELARVKVMYQPYSRIRPILKKVKSWFKSSVLELRLVERYGSSVDAYFEQKTNYNVPICKKYNAAILNWHTVDSQAYPNFKLYELYEKGNLIGILIYLERRKYEVEILKVDFNDDGHYQKYIPAVLDHISSHEGARLIYMWETKNPPLRESLEEKGFIINHDNPNQFGYHFFPALIYSQLSQIEGIDIFDANNYELDIFTRDFV